MDLKEIMSYKNFCVVGDTLNEEKYAYKIKHELLKNGYNVTCVYKELKSLNDVSDLEIVDLCINPVKGFELLQECNKTIKAVLIQPGAQSDSIIEFLKNNNIPYLEGCALVGLKLYQNK